MRLPDEETLYVYSYSYMLGVCINKYGAFKVKSKELKSYIEKWLKYRSRAHNFNEPPDNSPISIIAKYLTVVGSEPNSVSINTSDIKLFYINKFLEEDNVLNTIILNGVPVHRVNTNCEFVLAYVHEDEWVLVYDGVDFTKPLTEKGKEIQKLWTEGCAICLKE